MSIRLFELMPPKRSTEVPGPLFGYTFQITRMLQLLLSAEPGDIVSVEVFDDLGVESKDKRKVAGQSKTAIDRNPVSNKSVDLWKTLSNWVHSINSKKVDPSNTTFELYLTTKRSGKVVDSFSEATTEDEAVSAYDAAKTAVHKEKGNRTEAEKYAAEFFNPDCKSNALLVIQGFKLSFGSGVVYDDLSALFKKAFVDKKFEELCIKNALGWVKMEAEKLLEKHSPCVLKYDDFHHEMTSYLEKLRRGDYLPSLTDAPTEDQIVQLESHDFVEQLRIIDSDSEEVREAISDYYLATADRVKWIEDGWVNSKTFGDLEEGLTRYWKNTKKQIVLDSSLDDKIIGRKLFLSCSNHQTRIEGMDPPFHFVPGCFHSLANSLSIGWHPDYPNLVKRGKSK